MTATLRTVRRRASITHSRRQNQTAADVSIGVRNPGCAYRGVSLVLVTAEVMAMDWWVCDGGGAIVGFVADAGSADAALRRVADAEPSWFAVPDDREAGPARRVQAA